jgi:DNA repair exonuclease SbcCD nuclease subunit
MPVFVHTADWQLGMRRHYLDPGAQGRFAQDRIDAVKAVGALAEEVQADFVTVGGDAFDDNQVDRQTVLRTIEALGTFPDIPVLLLPGNHDALDAGSVYRRTEFTSRLPANVRVVSDTTPIEVVPGVEVVGGPFPVRSPAENPLLAAMAPLPSPPGLRILLGHGNLDAVAGSFDQAGLLRLAELESWLADGRAHFVALGDRHSATDVGTTGRVWYAGAPEPTDYREDRSGTT